MEGLTFDVRGNLQPYSPIITDLATLENTFAIGTIRRTLLVNYLAFLEDFKKEILEKDFFSWINGSYVTKKPLPNDIDVVTFLDYKVYEQKEKLLNRYRSHDYRALGLDLYFVKIYPENHKSRFVTDFDKVEWLYLFGTDRKKQNKGFLQLNF